jgi:hypothetical protein
MTFLMCSDFLAIGLSLLVVCCMDHSDEEGNIDLCYNPMYITDRSLIAIARTCTKLESFSIAESKITTSGLQSVISNNPEITTLNLSSNDRLGDNTVDVIARFLPRLKELRYYWAYSHWLTDDSLIYLINAQEEQNGHVCLNLIGLQDEDSLTIRGLEYAIKKGVKVIEIDKETYETVAKLESDYDVKFWQAKYAHYMDGSRYERFAVHKFV